MNSDLGSINLRDLSVAFANAIFAAVIAVLYGVVIQNGFDLFSADWIAIGKLVANAVFVVFISSAGAAFGIDKNGKVLGRI